MKCAAPYGPGLTKVSTSHKILIFGDRQKRNSLYSLIAMLSIKFGCNWMKTVGAVRGLLKILISEILQNAPNNAKLNSNDLIRKVPYILSS